jgi:DNA-binding NtrC family response regulator
MASTKAAPGKSTANRDLEKATELVTEHFEARDLDGISPSAAAAVAVTKEEVLSSAWQQLQSDRARIEEAEQAMVRRALTENEGVITHAARSLGIARSTLASRIETFGMRSRTKRE